VLTTLKGRSAASAERVRLAGIEVVDDDDAIALEICERGTAVPTEPLARRIFRVITRGEGENPEYNCRTFRFGCCS
jgi:hypothetical protein